MYLNFKMKLISSIQLLAGYVLLGASILFIQNCIPVPVAAVCGDQVCDATEDFSTCASDCAPSGWSQPTSSTSMVQGGCQWIDAYGGTSDACMTNYYEGACTSLSSYGGITLFSTATGSTSIDPLNNICVDLGYTACTVNTASGLSYLFCGPDSIASASFANLFDLVRTANDDFILQRPK